MSTYTLFLLSGDAEKIRPYLDREKDIKVLFFSEKEFTTAGKTISRLRNEKGKIVFATKDLKYQRYLLVIKCFLFLAGKSRALFVDEKGKRITYALPKFLFVDSFQLLLELARTAYVISRTYFNLKKLEKSPL